jgi:hypothetical protein
VKTGRASDTIKGSSLRNRQRSAGLDGPQYYATLHFLVGLLGTLNRIIADHCGPVPKDFDELIEERSKDNVGVSVIGVVNLTDERR